MTQTETVQNINKNNEKCDEVKKHIPVLLKEVLACLAPQENAVYVDGTLGLGGYTRGILDHTDCDVIAIDRDETVFKDAQNWSKNYKGRLTLIHGSFSDIEQHIKVAGDKAADGVDGIVVDIGVSSMQIDEAERGFSFRFEGPLDMRMDQTSGHTAADLVNTMDETELANLIYQYGEERHSRKIAAEIIRTRAHTKFATTKDLTDAIHRVVPKHFKDKIDPATRTFQALRIAVNDELGELEKLLTAAKDILKVNGRLVVVTFHSLEDRIVKNFINELCKKPPSPSRYAPQNDDTFEPRFRMINKKPIIASDHEIKQNPRARSAKLRAIEKIKVCA